jgi:hypothetical protein
MKKASEIWDVPSQAFLEATACCKYCRRMTSKEDICVQADCPCHVAVDK